jgi:carbonic anhydrase
LRVDGWELKVRAISIRRGQGATIIRHRASLRVSVAESAHEKDDQAYQQNQAKSTATVNRAAQVKTAAAEQKQQHEKQEYKIHSWIYWIYFFPGQ